MTKKESHVIIFIFDMTSSYCTESHCASHITIPQVIDLSKTSIMLDELSKSKM